MYFSNMSNEELQHFHHTVGVDFSMSLTDVLNSNLFYVETIVADTIYRVCPLFYCEKITSNNSIDKILDTTCLILQKREKETYLSFTTNTDSNVIIDESLIDSKQIKEKLSMDEFNAFVYRLRKKGVLKGNIRIEEESYNGLYGTYQLNHDGDILRNDLGFIINEDIKNNPLTIKLIDPYFINAKYILTCTVISVTGANICAENKGEFIIKDTFTVDLVKDNEVALDLSNYTNDSVLLFDMGISISFDVPEIVNSNFTLDLIADKTRLALGESLILTATLTGESNVEHYNIEFFEDGELIGTGVTDENGVASITYNPVVSTNHIYSCKIFGLTRNVNVIVYNKNTILSLNSNVDMILINNNIVLNGVLTDYDGNPLSNRHVKLYQNNNIIDELETENDGTFTKTIYHNTVNNYTYRAEFESDGDYISTNSNIVQVTIYKYSSSITINSNASVVYLKKSGDTSSQFTISGTLLKEGTALANTTVKLYNNNTLIGQITTDTNGNYNKTLYPNGVAQTYNLKAVYEGSDTIYSATSRNVSVVARKIRTSITANVSKTEIHIGESVTVSGRLTDEFGNGINEARMYLITTNKTGKGFLVQLTNSNGGYSYSYNVPGESIGTTEFKVNLSFIDSNNLYESVESDTLSVDCVKYITGTYIQKKSTGSYEVGETIDIRVTSDDPNFIPESVNVVCNGVASTLTTKKSNTRDTFIFVIPNMGSTSGNLQITASYNGDNTHEQSSSTETIPVTYTVRTLTLSKNGSNLILNIKNTNNVNAANVTVQLIRFNLTGFGISYFDLNDVTTNNDGNIIIPFNLHGSGTIYATYNNINSNTINVTN